MYSLASPGEYNLAQYFREHPDLAARVGVAVDTERDDAELALEIAPAIGRFKRTTARLRAGDRAERAGNAARRLSATAGHQYDRVELDADILLGDLLADPEKNYVAFDLESVRVAVHRHALARARSGLRNFLDLAAYVDERGLHFAWRAGRGGLNLRPQVQERAAEVLVVDLRRELRSRRVYRPAPVLLADVLADLGLT